MGKTGLWTSDYSSGKLLNLCMRHFRPVKSLMEKSEDLKNALDSQFLEGILPISQGLTATDSLDILKMMRLQSSRFWIHTRGTDQRIQDLLSFDTTTSIKQQSSSLFILAFINAICLPFSLAAAILSIQSQFNEIGPKLKDMIILSFVLISMMLVFYKGCKIFLNFKRYLFNGGSFRSRTNKYINQFCIVSCGISFCFFLHSRLNEEATAIL